MYASQTECQGPHDIIMTGKWGKGREGGGEGREGELSSEGPIGRERERKNQTK